MIKFYTLKKQKGVLFGADARIALAIFAMLSIASVATLYNSNKKTQANGLIQELHTIQTAYQSFVADTVYDLTSYSTNTYYYNIKELLTLTRDSEVPYTLRYRGPYLSYEEGLDATSITLNQSSIIAKIVSRSYTNSWLTANRTEKCSDTDCFKWIMLENIDAAEAESIDFTMDNTSDHDSGKIRLVANGDNYDVYYALGKD